MRAASCERTRQRTQTQRERERKPRKWRLTTKQDKRAHYLVLLLLDVFVLLLEVGGVTGVDVRLLVCRPHRLSGLVEASLCALGLQPKLAAKAFLAICL